ncbi:MAG: hypothetical protein ACOCZV_01040 [Nanoarchaeota archaeon]
MEMNCKECGQQMKKTGNMNSGNATYILFTCTNCGQQEQKCTGIN